MLRVSKLEYLFDPLQRILSPSIVNRRAWSHRRLHRSMQRETLISMTTSLNKCPSQCIVLVWLCCLGVSCLKCSYRVVLNITRIPTLLATTFTISALGQFIPHTRACSSPNFVLSLFLRSCKAYADNEKL